MVYSKNAELNAGQNSFAADGLDHLLRGLYFLEIRSENIIKQEKIVKQ
jgi:hypothetical protein